MKKIALFLTAVLCAGFFAGCAAEDESKPVKKYTVTFMNDAVVFATQSVEEGKTASAPASVPHKIDYEFTVWQIDGVDYDFSTPVTADLVLSAKWKEAQSYIIKQEMAAYIDYLRTPVSNSYPHYLNWSKSGEGYKGKWNYIEGVLLNSLVQLYNSNPDNNASYMETVKNYVQFYIDGSGNFLSLKNNSNSSTTGGFVTGALDTICESRILFDLMNYDSADSRYATGIETTYTALNNITRCYDKDGKTGVCFSHKTDSAAKYTSWLDGFYMYAPFYARYGIYKNNQAAVCTEIYNQYKFAHDTMWDSNKKLHYHGIDTSVFKSGATAKSWACTDATVRPLGTSASFWLRSNGWFIVSLVDVIEYFPEGTQKEELKAILKESLEGILTHKAAAKNMFYNVVDGYDENGPLVYDISSAVETFAESSRKGKWQLNKTVTGSSGNYKIANYLETSGSAMIAYSCMKAARLGYVDSSYKAEGKKIFEDIYENEFEADIENNSFNLNHIIVQSGLKESTGANPDYYVMETVDSNEPKGIGPFIMAYVEYVK